MWRIPRIRALLVVGMLGLIAGPIAAAAHVYTNLLWFREVGQESVYWTTLEWKLLAPAAVFLGTTCFVLANVALADRRCRGRGPAPGSRRAVVWVWRFRALVYPLVALAWGIVALELLPDGTGRLLLLWTNRSGFGVEDPLFHRDVGFFVFSLPLYELVSLWLLETVVMAGVTTAAVYAVSGGLRAARAHLLLLAALGLLVLAWRVRLDELGYALPHTGNVVPGAAYTDVHVRLPAMRILTIVMVACAAVSAWTAFRRVTLVPLVVLTVVTLLTAAGASGLPALVERFDVEPQALAREGPYVADAIASTRRAYALDKVAVRSLQGSGEISASTLDEHRDALENVPLWDSSVLRPAMNELQTIGSYYGFPSTTVDRYTIDGVPRLMTVAARQLDLARLDSTSRSWANKRFAYTHGYGVVAVRGGQADADQYPSFAQREFRGSDNPLGLTQPRVYYGQRSALDPPYTVVRSARGEVEQPIPGTRAPDYHYDGPGGIPLSSPFRRIAFAARFGDLRLLLTETVDADSRIVVHRDARERVQTLAPFLDWDGQPQTVVADGHVRFVLHGYTTSDHYPYSAPVRVGSKRVNYVRGSAVAVVDGFSGAVSLYADAADPILRAWEGAYPSLFQPLSAMSPQLREHLRYPRRLFDAQAEAYATYHAVDRTGFWNGSDAWQQSQQLAGPVEAAGGIHFPDPPESADRPDATRAVQPWEMRPGYLLGRLPGDAHDRFLLGMPFTPRGRQNLVGYLAGSVDDQGRQELTLLSLPRDRLTVGPTQATRQVLASPEVNARLQLLNRESRDLGKASVNRTVLGVPRIVPVGDALVHVQPVYVTSGGTGLPRLQLVTVFANGRVGYGRDLEAALRRVLG
jgi:uncharacterized membrane protein (UPF0182 family)